jgi:hypothetical protein
MSQAWLKSDRAHAGHFKPAPRPEQVGDKGPKQMESIAPESALILPHRANRCGCDFWNNTLWAQR